MAKTGAIGEVTPFGEVEKTAEAATPPDAMTAFLETAALPLLAGLVVGAFLIYQFVRWYMAQKPVEVEVTRAEYNAAMQQEEEPDDEEERPVQRLERPWQVRS